MKEPYFAWEDMYKAINGPTGISKRASIKFSKLTLKPGCHVYLFETAPNLTRYYSI
jgi:hypothetical protein